MARPTLLTAELILKAREYIGSDENKKGILTIEGLSIKLDINRDTVYEWEKWTPPEQIEAETPEGTIKLPTTDDKTIELYAEFSDIVSRVRQLQAEKLIQNGLDGTYNPMITKLLLAKHDYVDTRQTDLTSKGEQIDGSVTVRVINEPTRDTDTE